MNRSRLDNLLSKQQGVVPAHPYDTAWVALVPHKDDPTRPAWPQALQYLCDTQLVDGGWEHEHVYYAHGRTISTLAALHALLTWGHREDDPRVIAGVQALHRYAAKMALEPYEPAGFEMLLPRLINELMPWQLDLPYKAWTRYEKVTEQKMALIGHLQPDFDSPRSWWFSMEMLPVERLAAVDERILTENGSIATSPAATAAYLRAKRLRGQDSPRAAAYLEHVLHTSKSGVGFCYPLEQFEVVWTLDILRRAGLKPSSIALVPYISRLYHAWQQSPQGMSWSQAFPIADGDMTAVSYTLLRWAGLQPDDHPFKRFWGTNYYLNYPDELVSSVSANIHALASLLWQKNDSKYLHMAERITYWLRDHMAEKGQFRDKWHFSALYATSRAIPVLAGWDDELAGNCLDFLLHTQDKSGGWGQASKVNLEETSYAVLGLVAANRAGLLRDKSSLRQADAYLKKQTNKEPVEAFWIGKTLFQPVGITHAYIYGARLALQWLDVDYQRPSLWLKPTLPNNLPSNI